MGIIFLVLWVFGLYISYYEAKKKEKKTLYITIIISLILFLLLFINEKLKFLYAVIDDSSVVLYIFLILLLPTLIYYIYYKTKKDNALIRGSFIIVSSFCWVFIGFLSLLVFAFGGFIKSETTDIKNYLKFDEEYIDSSFFPKKLDDFEVISYYYSYTHSLDYRYEVYLEVKTDDNKFQEIIDDISKESKLILDGDKKYYAIGDKNYISNDNKDISFVIFSKNNTIIYQRAFSQYNDKTIPHNISEEDYNNIYDFFNNPKGYNKYENYGTDTLTSHGAEIMTIYIKQDCVPVELTLYNDNQYELFTDYKACKPNKECSRSYTKSIKGTYDYDVLEILKEDNIDDKLYHSTEERPEYEIFIGDYYVEKDHKNYYSIKKGTINKSLNELLKIIEIDLDTCASPDYNK